MKLLLDENLPKRLRQDLKPHQVFTVSDMGWNGRSNGVLLSLMLQHGFHALLTFDKNMGYQQNFERYTIPVLVLMAEDNTYDTLLRLVPQVMQTLEKPLTAGPHPIQA